MWARRKWADRPQKTDEEERSLQNYDVFSRCHPAVNLLFFAGAIVLTVVLFHPAYLLLSLLCAGAYYALLRRGHCGRTFAFLLGAMLLVAAVNPLFNTLGHTVLFAPFGRPYTWEALCYGGCTGLMFAAVSLWFLCGGIVLTSDKFTSLFGAIIPSISLVLVMVLRLIPAYWRKGRQIAGARKCIGRSGSGTRKEKLQGGMAVLTALSGWALEGSVVTADSMRCRGYGSAGRRTTFQLYRFTGRDAALTAVMLALLAAVIYAGTCGCAEAVFLPALDIAPLAGAWPLLGLAAYGVFLLIPTFYSIREAILWHSLRSKI